MNTAPLLHDESMGISVRARVVLPPRPRPYLASYKSKNGHVTTFDAHGGRTTRYHYNDKLTQPTARIDPAGEPNMYEDAQEELTIVCPKCFDESLKN